MLGCREMQFFGQYWLVASLSPKRFVVVRPGVVFLYFRVYGETHSFSNVPEPIAQFKVCLLVYGFVILMLGFWSAIKLVIVFSQFE